MPPTPKHPSTRARRNRSSTATELVVRKPLEIPTLPQRFVLVKSKGEDGKEVEQRLESEWHPQAVKVWEEVWDSEMIEEFLASDVGEIERLTALVHQFWVTSERGSSTGLALMSAEIKSLRKQYGLNPMARRSLDWTIAQTEESRSRTRRPVRPVDAEIPDADVIELPPSAPADDPIDTLYD